MLLFTPSAAMTTSLPTWAIDGAEKVVPLAATCSPYQLLVPCSFQ
jgi:hypothetical protein